MERLIYIGTVVEEGYGTPPDYEIGDLYKMNRFVRYLIQNIDDVREKLSESFPSDKVTNFEAKIEKFDEFECAYFRNLDIYRFEDYDNEYVVCLSENDEFINLEAAEDYYCMLENMEFLEFEHK